MQEEGLAIAVQLYARHAKDRNAQSRVASLACRTGRLAFEAGEAAVAINHLEISRVQSLELLRYDPDNVTWQDSLALSATDLAAAALLTGDANRAVAELAREEVAALLAGSTKRGIFTPRLQAVLAARAVAAHLSEAKGDTPQRLALAQKNVDDLGALDDASSPDAIALAGEAEIMLGDALAKSGNPGAEQHWRHAERLNDGPRGPRAVYAAMQVACRRGDRDMAAGFSARLKQAGYIRPLSAAVADKCGN